MILTYQYRLLPTARQRVTLDQILESQRQLYNAALEERITAYQKAGKTITLYDQTKSLTVCRADLGDMAELPVSLQRGTLKRVDEAYKGFFRRKKGFPRFRGRNWFKSFSFTEFSGIRLTQPNRVNFKGMSSLRFHLHRPLPSDIRAVTFKKESSGDWLISFQVKVTPTERERTGKEVGLDLGITHLFTLSNGVHVPNIRVARKAEKSIRLVQRQLSRTKRQSKRRLKVKDRLQRAHKKVANTRKTYLHQVSAALVKEYDKIAVEDLKVKNLSGGPLAKSFHDAAWSKLLFNIDYKAERAGVDVVRVKAYNTSQECSGCGAVVKKALSERVHSCPNCKITLDRDVNAAKVILHRAVVRPESVNVVQ